MNFKLNVLALAATVCVATASHANIVTFSVNTAGGPIFNRLVEDLSTLSSTGTAVPFSAYSFNVSASGNYTFLSTAGFDNFTFLYTGIFNRTQPAAGALAANDDLLTASTSGFSYSLNAGTTYTFVTTGFENIDFGVASNTIGGPGVITAVPEPSVWLSMALGLVAVAAVRQRKLQV